MLADLTQTHTRRMCRESTVEHRQRHKPRERSGSSAGAAAAAQRAGRKRRAADAAAPLEAVRVAFLGHGDMVMEAFGAAANPAGKRSQLSSGQQSAVAGAGGHGPCAATVVGTQVGRHASNPGKTLKP